MYTRSAFNIGIEVRVIMSKKAYFSNRLQVIYKPLNNKQNKEGGTEKRT